MGGFQAEGVFIRHQKDVERTLQFARLLRQVLAKPLAGCVGPRCLTCSGINAAAAGVHQLVEPLQRSDALPSAVLVQAA